MKFGVYDFFKDIFNFFKAGTILGIDIGTASVKMAEMSFKSDRPRLENYILLETKSYLEHPNQALQTSSLKLVEKDAIEILKIALREMKPKTKTAVVGIPAFVSFVVPIDMPAFSAEETSKVVGYQARQYIPLPISEVSLDWLKIEEYQSERGEIFQRILLMAIPNEVIRKYRTIFKAVGVAVTALEIESLALVRALRGSDNKLTLSVDIGAEATSIVISENGIVKYQSSTDYGGIYLTQALSRSLGISLSRAEELKRRRGLLGAGGEMELSTLLTPFLDVIIQECRHVKDVYERRYGKTVTKLCLVGGGANLPGIEKYFSEEIGLPILTPPIFSGLSYDPNLEPAVKTLSNALLPAIGLAKRYFQ